MTEEQERDEQNVLNAIDLLIVLGEEIAAFLGRFEHMLNHTAEVIKFKAGKDVSEDYWFPDGSWSRRGMHRLFKGSSIKRQVKSGNLSLIVDLGVPNGIAQAAGGPIALVAWEVGNNTWEGFFEDTDEPGWPFEKEEYNFSIVADRLIVEDAKGTIPASKHPWVFAVPLFSLTTNQSLRRCLIDPAVRLLSGEEPENVFSKVPEALGFSWRDGLATRAR